MDNVLTIQGATGAHLFHLLRIAIGTDTAESFDGIATDEEWEDVLRLCHEHTLMSVMLPVLVRMPRDKRPERSTYLNLLSRYDQDRLHNQKVNTFGRDLVTLFSRVGLQVCMLKGLGVAMMYPQPLVRVIGDLDMWVRTEHGVVRNMDDVSDVIRRLRRFDFASIGSVVYHHIEWDVPVPEAVPVEVHLRPLYFNNPIINRRFQHWCAEQSDTAFTNLVDGLPVPAPQFNAIYLLAHIHHHLLFEGVGLRHITDYAVLLTHTDVLQRRDEIVRTACRLHLKGIMGALMYVMQVCYGIPNEKLLCAPDAKRGKLLLCEVMRAGNFGYFDERLGRKRDTSVWDTFWLRTRHRTRFLFAYPGEILFDIPFRLWHWCWRRLVARKLDN